MDQRQRHHPERGRRWANVFGGAVLVALIGAITIALRADHDALA